MLFAGKAIRSSNVVELLGVILDNNINFEIHIKNISFNPNLGGLFRGSFWGGGGGGGCKITPCLKLVRIMPET